MDAVIASRWKEDAILIWHYDSPPPIVTDGLTIKWSERICKGMRQCNTREKQGNIHHTAEKWTRLDSGSNILA